MAVGKTSVWLRLDSSSLFFSQSQLGVLRRGLGNFTLQCDKW